MFLCNSQTETRSAMTLDETMETSRVVADESLLWPDDIENIFDGVTYSKGSALVWMMYNALGEDTFFAALAEYLQQM